MELHSDNSTKQIHKLIWKSKKKALNDIVKEQTGSTPQITGLLEIGENFSSSLEKPTDKITYFKIEES